MKKLGYTRNRYVAMLDIMGFKLIIKKEKPADIYKLFDKIYKEIQEQTNTISNNNLLLDISIFSDTIIIVSNDDSRECYEDIIFSCACFMNIFIKHGYAINGAISYGKVTYDNLKNICYGKPIVNAHTLQEELQFYGIVVDSSVTKHVTSKYGFVNNFKYLNYLGVDWVIELKVPFKNEGWKKMYCVNWCERYFDKNTGFEEQVAHIKQNIQELYEKYINNGKGIVYVMNTEIVLKQWYDFVSKTNNCNGMNWGHLLSEDIITNCPS